MSLNPENTFVIIFGASQWDDYPDLNCCSNNNGDNPYQNAAKGMKDYFLKQLGISENNVLFLFDNNCPPTGLIDEMRSFLNREVFQIDLFFYFVGHGDVQEQCYYLLTKSAKKDNLASFFEMKHVVGMVNKHVDKIRNCYFILDACYADQTFSDLQKVTKVSTMLLASCHQDKRSVVVGKMPMFTQALLKALDGRTDSTFDGIYKSVVNILKETHGEKAIIPQIKDINQGKVRASLIEILPYQDYEYDIFVSYMDRGEGIAVAWINECFQPLLEHFLEDGLGKPPKIFWARLTLKGNNLQQYMNKLAFSRCLIPCWSPSYLSLGWASHECVALRGREPERISKLICPVIISDSENFDEYEFTKGITEPLNCRDYVYHPNALKQSPKFGELHDTVKNWVERVVMAVKSAPPWQRKWLDEQPQIAENRSLRSFHANPRHW